jgi:predicted ArsR family transcriptional regulator
MNPLDMFRKKFELYRKTLDEAGEEKAWDTLFQGYPERQRQHMGAIIEKYNTLAEAFDSAVSLYKQLGMDMQVVDISNAGKDAVLEIQRTCPALQFNLHKDFGFEKPCHVICEMDIAATNTGFADVGMKGSILCSQADGNSVCMFKYERLQAK